MPAVFLPLLEPIGNDDRLKSDQVKEVSTSSEAAETTSSPRRPISIQPLKFFQPSFADVEESDPTVLNRTLDWLDLWNNDPKCVRHQVRLLERGTTKPAALVS